ncbi:hypothetical protein [Quisquiliibacterium transsilvanicum]|uniref:Uncharacterized protein n=1 Tax=Quisquiliibacterium transsilvanicum TaxID=1549638 RepID=A0A7W8HFU2_9BURK|nr:hypothetical protein [Quisquiliibacterium transsilvanicum]
MEALIDLDALKRCQQAASASGDHAAIGTTLQVVGELLAESCALRYDEDVLDVAEGNGTASLAAEGASALERDLTALLDIMNRAGGGRGTVHRDRRPARAGAHEWACSRGRFGPLPADPPRHAAPPPALSMVAEQRSQCGFRCTPEEKIRITRALVASLGVDWRCGNIYRRQALTHERNRMATRKTTKKSELAQAGDHLSAAAKELGSAVSHKMGALGDAVSSGVSRARKQVRTSQDQVARGISSLVKSAEKKFADAQKQLEKAGKAAGKSVASAEKKLEATRRAADRKLAALQSNAERKARALQKAVEKEAAAIKKAVAPKPAAGAAKKAATKAAGAAKKAAAKKAAATRPAAKTAAPRASAKKPPAVKAPARTAGARRVAAKAAPGRSAR